MSKINPIPEGYHSITPSLVVPNAKDAMALYGKVLNAEKIELIEHEGRTMHAEVKIGNSILMLADENEEWGLRSPAQVGGNPVSLYLYVDDVDSQHQVAIENGFVELMPVADMFWGDRFSQVQDPFGHIWSLATHVEALSQEEITRRMEAS